jgi:hypothetical protein
MKNLYRQSDILESWDLVTSDFKIAVRHIHLSRGHSVGHYFESNIDKIIEDSKNFIHGELIAHLDLENIVKYIAAKRTDAEKVKSNFLKLNSALRIVTKNRDAKTEKLGKNVSDVFENYSFLKITEAQLDALVLAEKTSSKIKKYYDALSNLKKCPKPKELKDDNRKIDVAVWALDAEKILVLKKLLKENRVNSLKTNNSTGLALNESCQGKISFSEVRHLEEKLKVTFQKNEVYKKIMVLETFENLGD